MTGEKKLDSPELKEVIRDVLQDYDQYSKCVHRALIDGIEPLIKDARKELLKELETYAFAEPQDIPQSGREPVIICLTASDLQDLRRE